MQLGLEYIYEILQIKAFQYSHFLKKKHTDSESSLSRNLADPLEKIVQGSRENMKQEHSHHA